MYRFDVEHLLDIGAHFAAEKADLVQRQVAHKIQHGAERQDRLRRGRRTRTRALSTTRLPLPTDHGTRTCWFGFRRPEHSLASVLL